MKILSKELEKLSTYSGVECAKQILELYHEFPNNEKQIDEYIEKRAYDVAASADEIIAKAVRYRHGLVNTRVSGLAVVV